MVLGLFAAPNIHQVLTGRSISDVVTTQNSKSTAWVEERLCCIFLKSVTLMTITTFGGASPHQLLDGVLNLAAAVEVGNSKIRRAAI